MIPIRNALLAGLVIAAAPVAAALAQEPIQLKFASPSPPQSPVHLNGVNPWIEAVQKASENTVEIKLFPGGVVGNFANVLDRTINNVAAMSWGIVGPYSAQFPQTDVASLPFIGGQSFASSVALWRMYSRGIIKDSWDKVKPLALFNFPPSAFHSTKPIRTLEDFKGMKIAVTLRSLAEMIELLGAAPVTMQTSEMYQAQQRGVVNSIAVGWGAFPSFKFEEVTKYHMDGAFGDVPAFIIMNKDSYQGLPAKAKKAIDDTTGEVFSLRMGRAADQMDDSRDRVRSMPDHTVSVLEAKEVPAWKARVQPLIDRWVSSTPDGAKILAAYQAEFEKLVKEK
jgi:TRAP-type C4-dicarboxylate transport system substrate-binding protein